MTAELLKSGVCRGLTAEKKRNLEEPRSAGVQRTLMKIIHQRQLDFYYRRVSDLFQVLHP